MFLSCLDFGKVDVCDTEFVGLWYQWVCIVNSSRLLSSSYGVDRSSYTIENRDSCVSFIGGFVMLVL